ncbi:MAG: MOSC domain-containing protein [Candidatus Sericytochromatia bacterium]|nr:MOSC domain-containing protein [Candidatus Sericytochromatia bacterium]
MTQLPASPPPDGPRLASLQVGLPRDLGSPDAADPLDTPWRSGIFKAPVAGPVWLGRENLAGDGQAALAFHGGPERAVLAYGAGHYPAWQLELDTPAFPPGAFGENFTVAGLDEGSVCLGDVWAVGEALLQVSEPRQPCAKLARRLRRPDIVALVQRTGRTGWYMRVLQEGHVAAGQAVRVASRPHPDWPMARVNAAVRERAARPDEAASLAAVEALSPEWRAKLRGG